MEKRLLGKTFTSITAEETKLLQDRAKEIKPLFPL